MSVLSLYLWAETAPSSHRSPWVTRPGACPSGQPPDQPRPAHHGRRPAAPPHRRPRLLRPQGRSREDTHGSDALPQAAAVRHRLPPDDARPPGTAGGPREALEAAGWEFLVEHAAGNGGNYRPA